MKLFKGVFLQLLIIYSIIITFISLKLIYKYCLHLGLLAFVIGAIGAFIIWKPKKLKISKYWIFLALAILLFIRIVPYIDNSVPLGYDPGIYKYAMEQYKDNHQIEQWIYHNHPSGLFLFTKLFYFAGFNSSTILIHWFIFFELLLGFMIYLASKEYFNNEVGILAILLYSVSVVQFKVFEYMYYKNVAGLILLLASLYLLKKKKTVWFILCAGFLGAVHRPTFLLFAVIYFIEFIKNIKRFKYYIITGAAISIIAFLFYIKSFTTAITPFAKPLVTASIGSGTFINFFTYKFLVLAYLPLGIFGAVKLFRKKLFNVFFIWFIITFLIVYLKLIFYNRFIIHLDIAMIITSAYAAYLIISEKRILGIIAVSILLISGFIITLDYSISAKPMLDEKDINFISNLNKTEENSSILVLSSYYSPWVLGYSNRKTIAPGQFANDKWSYEQWQIFWSNDDVNLTSKMLSDYDKPLYIFIGKYDFFHGKFNNSCFLVLDSDNKNTIYKYVC